jgi:hypothetical protein
MKKHLLLSLAIVLGIYTNLHAQGITWGVKGGLAIGAASGTGIVRSPTNARIGFNAGLFANISIDDDFSISPEFTYIQKGFIFNGTKIVSDYIQFATTLKIDMGDSPVYLTLGPFVSYLPQINELIPAQKSLEVGGLFGLGYRFSTPISLETRYQFSTNIGVLPSSDRFRNTAIDVSLCYHF